MKHERRDRRASGQRHRVLVIDDSPSIHEDSHRVLVRPSRADSSHLNSLLDTFFGAGSGPGAEQPFDPCFAARGAEGFERLREALAEGEPCSLALGDMRMPPGRDGIRTAREILAVDPLVRVVICSAYSDRTRDEIIEAPGDPDHLHFLDKPCDPEDVLALAEMLVREWDTAGKAA